MSALSIIGDPLGRLSLDALPFYEMVTHATSQKELINAIIAGFAACVVVIGAVVVFALITRYRKWRPLWSEWLTSADAKKIGIMYCVLAFVMMARGVIEAILMRTQKATALNGGFLSPEHYAELFTTHGTIMIFFLAMPLLIGIINFVMPQQIGARDVSFPVMNSVSLGLTAAGAALIMISLVVGGFSTGGWFGYPTYTEAKFHPGPGVDYWIWALTLSGIGNTLTGINFAVTIYKERAPGMKLMRMPLFTWMALVTSIMMIFAMPPLTVATAQLALDRYMDFHFFTHAFGGNMMHFVNLFWLFGHPEVYIIVLPSFGIFSEVVSTYAGKALYGYRSLVWAGMAIAVLSFTVWLHHFFTMGQNANINAVFGIASMLIGIPTGVKIYDWLWTMFRGRIRFTAPMIYSIGFILMFVVGGMSGILLANPAIDYQVHNTVFLVAHFHNVIIPGTLFGLLAGYHFWFPKAFGFRLNERWGQIAAVLWIIGFMLAFLPLYALGLMGMPRRSVSYYVAAYQPLEIAAFIGALVIGAAVAAMFLQFWLSIKHRNENRVPLGDPWDGRSLEWASPAPVPEYNFPVIPEINDRDAWTSAKQYGTAYQEPDTYGDIKLPANSALGPATGALGLAAAFGLVWYIWWLVILAGLGCVAAMAIYGFSRDTVKTIPADEVRQAHQQWLQAVREATPVARTLESKPVNQGLAKPAVAEAPS